MLGYRIIAGLGDRYRTVYYNGKRWIRCESGGLWQPAGVGWTTVEHSRNVSETVGDVIGIRGL